ncbi:hypothetical protein ES703_07737 [subsurface metagenome]
MKKEPLYPHVPKGRLGAFICGQCGERFHSMEELNKHLEKEHPEAFASVAQKTLGGQVTPGYMVTTAYERDIKEVQSLVSGAAHALETAETMDDIDSALWRLVDAAGITARYASHTAVGTYVSPTGRGYFIKQT